MKIHGNNYKPRKITAENKCLSSKLALPKQFNNIAETLGI